METSRELNFLDILLPLCCIIFIITIGIILLSQHFQKNLYYQVSEREKLKNQHHEVLIMSTIQTQEEERKRIAQDLHDELGAALAIARMHLVQIEQRMKDNDAMSLQALQSIRGFIESALTSMRRISHKLMPPQLESFGLIKTLEYVATQVNHTSEINMEINVAENIQRLPWPVELSLYRVTMELINNTLKYAEASRILIEIKSNEQLITYVFSDNGKGLPYGNSVIGLGHKNIEARVIAIGATLTMGNASHGGFNAIIKIPVNF